MNLTLEKIAEYLQGELKGDPNKLIVGAAPFEVAGSEQITFAGGAKYLKKLADCPAGAVIVPLGSEEPSKNLICVKNPQVAFIRILELLHPVPRASAYMETPGISPDARIGRNFVCGADVIISHFAIIGNDVSMGDRVTIYPGVVIGDHVTIGSDVTIYPNVSIYAHCIIGSRIIIHAGTVIGSDGFGFAPDKEKYCKIPHRGIVQIDDDVEIGANNAIDRATFGKTWIQRGAKTDNLVHVAHNVTVGENTLLVAQVGISGSTSIGKHAILAGQAGVSGHLQIGNNVIIGPQAGIAKSIADGEIVSGSPEIPHKQWLRVQTIIPKLPEMKKQLNELQKRIEDMEKKSSVLVVRKEKPEDIVQIRYVNEKAFGRMGEADLVDALRNNGKAVLSLVAIMDDKIVGHIMFSPVSIVSADREIPALGLAPMAVLPEYQKSGIGSALVNQGIGQCRKTGYPCVVVLGHPDYYPQFGFVPASRYGIRSEYDVPDDVFMLTELKKGALSDCSGIAKYSSEFGGV